MWMVGLMEEYKHSELKIKLNTEHPEYYEMFLNGDRVKLTLRKNEVHAKVHLSNDGNVLKVQKNIYGLNKKHWILESVHLFFLSFAAGYYDNLVENEGSMEALLEVNITSSDNGELILTVDEKNNDKFIIERNNLELEECQNVIRENKIVKNRLAQYKKIKITIMILVSAFLLIAILYSYLFNRYQY